MSLTSVVIQTNELFYLKNDVQMRVAVIHTVHEVDGTEENVGQDDASVLALDPKSIVMS